jgi:hypothetical protein
MDAETERAGLEHDGGQVPARRYIKVIAGSIQRVTPRKKKLLRIFFTGTFEPTSLPMPHSWPG